MPCFSGGLCQLFLPRLHKWSVVPLSDFDAAVAEEQRYLIDGYTREQKFDRKGVAQHMGMASLDGSVRPFDLRHFKQTRQSPNPATFARFRIAYPTPEKVAWIVIRERVKQRVNKWRQRHIDRYSSLRSIEEEVSFFVDASPLKCHGILNPNSRPTHQKHQCADPIASMFEIVTAQPIAVRVRSIDQLVEFLTCEVVGWL